VSTYFKRIVHAIDSHTEDNATRVIVGGVRTPPGSTLLERRNRSGGRTMVCAACSISSHAAAA
jgi:proline racemase